MATIASKPGCSAEAGRGTTRAFGRADVALLRLRATVVAGVAGVGAGWLLAGMPLLLSGCAAGPTSGTAAVSPIPAAGPVSPGCPAWVKTCATPAAINPVGDIGDLPRLIQTAEDLLLNGDEQGAWRQLNEALKIDPRHRPALLLMSQISDDPRKLLGDISEPYLVGRGETLRQIAAARLGDARLFYALARYNDIAVPRQLEAGRAIKLPLPATGAGPARPTSVKRLAPAGGDGLPVATPTGSPGSAAGSAGNAPGGVRSAISSAGSPPAPTPAAAATPAPAPALSQSGGATGSVAGSTSNSASGGAAATTSATAAPAAAAGDGELAFRRAAAAEKAGRTEAAYAGYMRAYTLGHPAAAERAAALRQDLILRHKRIARAALERQDLDGAMRSWRAIAELDPSDSAPAEELRKLQRRKDTLNRR